MTRFGDSRRLFLDAVWVVGTLAVLGVVGALVWDALVDLPSYQRTAQGAVLDQVQLAGLIGIDGWFVAVGGVAGLVAGGALMYFRPGDPLLTVVWLAAGGALAAWLMVEVGLLVGPADPGSVLSSLKPGEHAAVQLHPHATGVEFIWPIAALLGGLLVLLSTGPDTGLRTDPAHEQVPASGD